MNRSPSRVVPLLPFFLLALPVVVHGQARAEWNGARALDLVGRARITRHAAVVDTAFASYRGEARGHVYFFIDRPDSDERTLVKVDQVALEIYWQAPDRAGQRIVGLRDEKLLPTNVRYHLDHLTVVQDDFGDFIRLGDGDEVSQVLHPAGPAAETVYDYLLADSLTLSYGGGGDEVRVYEIQVRPKDIDRPGFVGTLFVDQANAAIVRMSFTFTPSSYVDPHLDYIRISLDNALWMGRYWLPYRQEVELRREMPLLDFLAGSIIRGRFEIGNYDFNAKVSPVVLMGRGVISVPEAERRSYPFEAGLFDGVEEQGLAASTTLEEVRAQAAVALSGHYLSGLSPLRLHLGSTSDLLRYDRANGYFVGAGVALRPGNGALIRSAGGYSVGRRAPSGTVTVSSARDDPIGPTLELYWDRTLDIGMGRTSSTGLNSTAALAGIQDYLDPFHARGASLAFSRQDRTGPTLTLRFERHRSARDVVSERPGVDLRPVRSVDPGTLGAVTVQVPFTLPLGGATAIATTLGRLESRTFTDFLATGRWTVTGAPADWDVEVAAAVGAVSSQAPPQSLFLLGGRGTLPGHDYRSFVGDRFWLVRGEATLPLRPPWVNVRAVGAVGTATLGDRALPPDWRSDDSNGVKGSVGLGLSFGWDVLRIDLARGLGTGGGWEWIFSVTPRFQSWM